MHVSTYSITIRIKTYTLTCMTKLDVEGALGFAAWDENQNSRIKPKQI